MSDSLSVATAAPKIIEVGGKTYRFAPLTFRALGELELWVNTQIPDAMTVAKKMIEGLPDSIAEKIAMEGLRLARLGPVKLNTEEAANVIASPAGVCQVLYVSLRKHQPDVTLKDAEELMDNMGASDIESIQDFVFGNSGPKA